jgi:peptidoglycan/LPS O-acetylase OafA/YrhL
VLRWRGHAIFAPLRWGPLVYLGSISYGVYLYHGFVGAAVAPHLPDVGWKLVFLIKSAITIGVAAISWRLLERPLNALKLHFPYVRAARPPADGAPRYA